MIIRIIFLLLLSPKLFAGLGQDTFVLIEILKSSLDQLEQLHDLAGKTGKTLDKIQQYNTAVRDFEYKLILIENLVDTTKELGSSNPQNTQDIINILQKLKGECRTISELLKEEREKIAHSKKDDLDIQSAHRKGRMDRRVEKHQLSSSTHADANVAEASRQTAINTSWILKSTNDIKDYQNRQLSLSNKEYSENKEFRSRELAREIEKKKFYNFDYGVNSESESVKTCQFCIEGGKK